MKKQTLILFYFLSIYVIIQFIWWGYLLIKMTNEFKAVHQVTGNKVSMIIGEGTVFLLILLFGLWKLKSSITKEQELSKRQHNFLLSVTHELKTPLASIKLYLQTLLKHQLSPDKNKELLEKTLIENKRLEEVVESILLSAAIENKQIETQNNWIDLLQLLNDLKIKYNQKYQKEWIKIYHNQPTCFLYIDEFIFKTICINLIENVQKYVGINEILEIHIQNDQQINISFIDKGEGIPEKYHSQLFEKFFRIGEEETRKTKGTGLGLYIVKEFVNISNGKIEYFLNKPKGSVFKITLPQAHQSK
ncbi:MAG: HAMP domain-containing histidine kinase [Flavobacteriia bacterium]|nr:HAMP domain-containing histidine kinase [Flavobacteriia bacterium]